MEGNNALFEENYIYKCSRRIQCPVTKIIYGIGDQIGSGSASVVFRCYRFQPNPLKNGIYELDSSQEYAVKVLNLKSLRLRDDFDKERVKLQREIVILSKLNHPCIVNLFHVIETHDELFFIMKLVKGGELFYKIVEYGSLSEDQTRYVLIQILHALEYMHNQNVIHRDLKPENILIVEEPQSQFYKIQVADFGLAKLVSDANSRAKTFVGTPQYWAPEVIDSAFGNTTYGPAADLWSLGCVLYVMIGGCYPFDSRLGPIDKLIKGGKFHFNYPRFKDVSSEAKQLITRLLTVDVSKRITLKEVFQHPWVNNFSPPSSIPSLSFNLPLTHTPTILSNIKDTPTLLSDSLVLKTPEPFYKDNQKYDTLHVLSSNEKLNTSHELENETSPVKFLDKKLIFENTTSTQNSFQAIIPLVKKSSPAVPSTNTLNTRRYSIKYSDVSTGLHEYISNNCVISPENPTHYYNHSDPINIDEKEKDRHKDKDQDNNKDKLELILYDNVPNTVENISDNYLKTNYDSFLNQPFPVNSSDSSIEYIQKFVFPQSDEKIYKEFLKKNDLIFNFDILLNYYISIVHRFHWSFLALRHSPVGTHIRTCIQEVYSLHQRSLQVIHHFETVSSQVLLLFSELYISVKAREFPLASLLLEDIYHCTADIKNIVEFHNKHISLFIRQIESIIDNIRLTKTNIDRELLLMNINPKCNTLWDSLNTFHPYRQYHDKSMCSHYNEYVSNNMATSNVPDNLSESNVDHINLINKNKNTDSNFFNKSHEENTHSINDHSDDSLSYLLGDHLRHNSISWNCRIDRSFARSPDQSARRRPRLGSLHHFSKSTDPGHFSSDTSQKKFITCKALDENYQIHLCLNRIILRDCNINNILDFTNQITDNNDYATNRLNSQTMDTLCQSCCTLCLLTSDALKDKYECQNSLKVPREWIHMYKSIVNSIFSQLCAIIDNTILKLRNTNFDRLQRMKNNNFWNEQICYPQKVVLNDVNRKYLKYTNTKGNGLGYDIFEKSTDFLSMYMMNSDSKDIAKELMYILLTSNQIIWNNDEEKFEKISNKDFNSRKIGSGLKNENILTLFNDSSNTVSKDNELNFNSEENNSNSTTNSKSHADHCVNNNDLASSALKIPNSNDICSRMKSFNGYKSSYDLYLNMLKKSELLISVLDNTGYICQILRQILSFWFTFNKMIDKVLHIKTYGERFLKYGTNSPDLIKCFFDRLEVYHKFWKSLLNESRYFVINYSKNFLIIDKFILNLQSATNRMDTVVAFMMGTVGRS